MKKALVPVACVPKVFVTRPQALRQAMANCCPSSLCLNVVTCLVLES